MSETPRHSYNEPDKGRPDWDTLLNENFRALDREIEMRGPDADRDDADAEPGTKYLATDTGVVYTGTASGWEPEMLIGTYDTSGTGNEVTFGENIDDVVTVNGDIEVSGTKHFVETVSTDAGPREVVYTATESPTPRTEVSGNATLTDGRAEIDLPDHFSMVTDASEGILVQTTPYDQGTNGLVVTERSSDRIVVEDADGTGDYEFGYSVKGTRIGQVDKEVVREPRVGGTAFAHPISPGSSAQSDD